MGTTMKDDESLIEMLEELDDIRAIEERKDETTIIWEDLFGSSQ